MDCLVSLWIVWTLLRRNYGSTPPPLVATVSEVTAPLVRPGEHWNWNYGVGWVSDLAWQLSMPAATAKKLCWHVAAVTGWCCCLLPAPAGKATKPPCPATPSVASMYVLCSGSLAHGQSAIRTQHVDDAQHSTVTGRWAHAKRHSCASPPTGHSTAQPAVPTCASHPCVVFFLAPGAVPNKNHIDGCFFFLAFSMDSNFKWAVRSNLGGGNKKKQK